MSAVTSRPQTAWGTVAALWRQLACCSPCGIAWVSQRPQRRYCSRPDVKNVLFAANGLVMLKHHSVQRRGTMEQVALVTGGARRIGRSIVERSRGKGYAVAIHCNRSTDEAEEIAVLDPRAGRTRRRRPGRSGGSRGASSEAGCRRSAGARPADTSRQQCVDIRAGRGRRPLGARAGIGTSPSI